MHVLCIPLLPHAHPHGLGSIPCLPFPIYPGHSDGDGPCALIPDEQLPDSAGSQARFSHHVPGSHRLR